ncbi:MAG TPA: OmpA family protein [Anaeromyxobacteraceae bacterium]|nr:OmpA family protein [Anaeromyxobacteraceae bacterium]
MRRLAVLLSLAALTGCVSQDTYRKKEAEADQLRQDWQAEQARRNDLQARFDAVNKQLDGLSADLGALKDKARANEGSLATKEAELKATQARLAELQALVDELSTSKKRLEAAKAELEKKSGEYEKLAGSLRGEIEAGRVELTELRGKMTVKMKDKILFSSGSATVGKDGLAALHAVADALRDVQGKTIRVEGHTDDVPTAGGAFPTNWELSTARALAVVRVLQDRGVDPTRLAAAGYGEYQPVAPNDSPEGRSQNRRIEIVLAAAEGAAAAPVAAPARRK